MARLQQYYRDTVVPKLTADSSQNAMEVPRITKITLNMGVGEAAADRKIMDAAVGDMAKITGQKPSHQGQEIHRHLQDARGLSDGLQGDAARRAHVRVSGPPDQHRVAAGARLPRRLGRALRWPRQLQHGRASEQIIFPEIQYDQIDQLRGMDITITTTARTTSKAGRSGSVPLSVPK